jgi:hypothetical protein
MTQQNQIQTQPINQSVLVKSMLIGAGIAFAAILFFIVGAETQAAWGEYWRIRPLIITPLAGATGGAVFYFLNYLSTKQGWSKALAIILGIVIYIVGLWMGIVLGLDGTLWN